jgi:hypothetical protein
MLGINKDFIRTFTKLMHSKIWIILDYWRSVSVGILRFAQNDKELPCFKVWSIGCYAGPGNGTQSLWIPASAGMTN